MNPCPVAAAVTSPLTVIPIHENPAREFSRLARSRYPTVSLGSRYLNGATPVKWVRVPSIRRRVPLSSIFASLTKEELHSVDVAREELLASMRESMSPAAMSPLTFQRLRAGLTQVTLAERSGIRQSKISFYENNPDKLTTRSAKKMAAVLNIDFRDLLS
jgi:DNA-binding XRE family transcriptional regulator